MTILIDAIVGGLILGGIYALAALGLNLQYGVAKILNLAHGEFIMIGAFFTYTLFVLFNISPLVTLFLNAFLGFGIGLILYKILFQRLKMSSKSEEKLAADTLLISFGLIFILQNIALLIWGSIMKSYSYLSSAVNILGFNYPLNRVVASFVAVSLSILIYLFLHRTRFGTAIRASSADVVGAQVVGIDVRNIQAISFALGAGIAGVTGALISMMFPTEPMVGMTYTLMSLIIIIIGGMGNFLGSMIAGLFLGVAESLGAGILGSGLRIVVNFSILLLILLIRPQGIFGGK